MSIVNVRHYARFCNIEITSMQSLVLGRSQSGLGGGVDRRRPDGSTVTAHCDRALNLGNQGM